MNGPFPNKNYLGRLAIVLHAHLPFVRKNEKNSLEEDWLFQAILECYIPLLQVMESSKKKDIRNTKLTLSLSPTLLSLLQNKQIQQKYSSWIKTRIEFLSDLPLKELAAAEFLLRNIKNNFSYWEKCSGDLIERFKKFHDFLSLYLFALKLFQGFL